MYETTRMESKTTYQTALESRRRFLKVGLVAAPLLMTLAARPARAQEVAGGTLGSSNVGGSSIDAEPQVGPAGVDNTDAFGVL
jgi:hypothetical protein